MGWPVARCDTQGDASGASQEDIEKEFRAAMDRLRKVVETESCVMFSTTVCPWCDRAAEFFAQINRPCRKIELDVPHGDRQQQLLGMALAMATQQRTVPNIFLGGKHLGGYDMLSAAYSQCKAGQMPSEHADICRLLTEE
mmetsp:Transcript_63509/g.143361  ORF Transcript_63509/g.143361 Transcript_63509/m.143361 type:complete len:140 (+) Transcript_63509:62-481(+)